MVQFIQHVVGSCDSIQPSLHFEIAARWNSRLLGYRQPRVSPCIESAIQHVNRIVAEEFEEPKQPRRAHSGNIVINDDLTITVYALRLDEVLDHP